MHMHGQNARHRAKGGVHTHGANAPHLVHQHHAPPWSQPCDGPVLPDKGGHTPHTLNTAYQPPQY
ncbi:hypothetical protein JCM16814_06400 [Desulfobaculum senezii]